MVILSIDYPPNDKPCVLFDNEQMNLSEKIYETDHRVIDEKYIRPICQGGYTRSYLNTIVTLFIVHYQQ